MTTATTTPSATTTATTTPSATTTATTCRNEVALEARTWDKIIDDLCEEKRVARRGLIEGPSLGLANNPSIGPGGGGVQSSGTTTAVKKKTCTKFNIAKKKFSKRKAVDGAKTQEITNVLGKDDV